VQRARIAAWLPAAAVLVVVAARALHAAVTGFFYEDAYITLRYARNLAEGHGFVFNPGERVLGTTTPLHALLLAPFGWLREGAALPGAAVAIGIASAGAAVALVFRLCRRLGLSDAVPVATALLFTVSHELIEASVAGMETMLVVALMFAGLALAVEGRLAAAGAALALLAIARVDGLPWVGLVLGYLWWDRRRFPARALAAFALVLLPWVIFATAYFGSPIPHSLTAKQVAYQPEPPGERLLAIWSMVHPFERSVVLLARALDVMFVVGVVAAARGPRALLVPALASLGHVVGLAAFAPHTAPWHVVPAAACFALVCAFGAVVAIRRALAGSWSSGAAAARALRLGLPAGFAVVALVSAGLRTVDAIDLLRRHMDNERAIPVAAARWLSAHSAPAAKVFAEPIGSIGYHSRRYVWDTVGMVSPALTAYRRRFPAGNRWFLEALRDLRPDFVVLRGFERPENRMFLHGGPLLPPEGLAWFDAHYRLAQAFEPVHRNIHSLAVYRRSPSGDGDPVEKASKN
jgi:hypothetical protein